MRFGHFVIFACTTALTASLAVPAHAQSSTNGSSKSVAFDIISALVNQPGSSKDSFASSTGVVEGLGSSKFHISTVYKDQDDYFPMAVDNSITQAALVSKGKDTKLDPTLPGADRVERWVVSSPAMKRNVEVEILPAKDPSKPAPMLYLLDGLSGPETSGWLRKGEMVKTLAKENVTVVMPTQAGGSIYTDWSAYDSKLGIQKWETFLSTELPRVLEAPSTGINWNGKKGIGGLSMGASGAVRNAAFYPKEWDAAFGISGCYSTMDPASKTLHRLITEPRGGHIDNMWGPYGSAEWVRHDLTLNKAALANLKDVKVFLSASDGNITPIDRIPAQETMKPHELVLWASIEQGMRHCTEKMDKAMKGAGVTADVRYTSGRIHDWPLYRDELPHAWASVRPALY